jgi:hypothetical protein
MFFQVIEISLTDILNIAVDINFLNAICFSTVIDMLGGFSHFACYEASDAYFSNRCSYVEVVLHVSCCRC